VRRPCFKAEKIRSVAESDIICGGGRDCVMNCAMLLEKGSKARSFDYEIRSAYLEVATGDAQQIWAHWRTP
jgi:hypothetical protein